MWWVVFCSACTLDTLPFSNLKDPKIAKEFDIPVHKRIVSKFTRLTAEYDKQCSVCQKAIYTLSSFVPCSQCRHLIRRKCSEIPNWTTADIEKHVKEWQGSACRLSTLSSFSLHSLKDNNDVNDDSKSAGPYAILIKMVECLSKHISGTLTDLINKSFSSGIHPSLLKFAKVIPIFKARSKLDVFQITAQYYCCQFSIKSLKNIGTKGSQVS